MRNPWQAIMIASAQDKGLRLTASEVRALSHDDAIETCAANGLTGAQIQTAKKLSHWTFWANQKPQQIPE